MGTAPFSSRVLALAGLITSLVLALACAAASAVPSRQAVYMSSMQRLRFMRVPAADVNHAFALEVASYPADEAASREKLEMRLRFAADYFWGAYNDAGVLCGFICATLSISERLTEESMSEHDANGHTLCIHSVVVEETRRRSGVGIWMLRKYLDTVAVEGSRVKRIVLLCKELLVPFYASAGFELLGPSGVVHGQDKWLLMALTVPTESLASSAM